MIIELDADGVIIAAEDAVESITGYDRLELIGRHFHLLVPADQAALVARNFERKRKDPALETHYHVDMERKDGTRRRVEVVSRRIDKPGWPGSVRAVIRAARSGARARAQGHTRPSSV